MNPFASPTGEPRPDMVLLLGVLLIALSLAPARFRGAGGRTRDFGRRVVRRRRLRRSRG